MLTTTLHPAFQTPIDNQIDGVTVNHNALLRDLLQSSQSLLEIAAEHKLTLQQLIVWAEQPAIRSLLDRADALALRIADHKAAQSRPGAVQLLAEHTLSLCESARDRDQAGRAARAILRLPIGSAEDPHPQPIANLRISRPARNTIRKHPANPRRATPPIPTSPDHSNSILIPVYRFSPNSIGPMGPIGPIGPIPHTPYEVIDSSPANGKSPPHTPAPTTNGHPNEIDRTQPTADPDSDERG